MRFRFALQSVGFHLTRVGVGMGLCRAGRQVLGVPLAELPGANVKLRRYLRQPLAAVQQPLHCLRLELPREAPSGSRLRHPSLLGCLGSLANPPAPGGKSNTMVGMYTMTRYFTPGLLEERGIAHFDAWAVSFGEIVDSMEISPDGATLRPNARFSKFVNLPELIQMFRSFSDVQTADMLKLPVPPLKGGKAQVISCPMSPTQVDIQANTEVSVRSRDSGGG